MGRGGKLAPWAGAAIGAAIVLAAYAAHHSIHAFRHRDDAFPGVPIRAFALRIAAEDVPAGGALLIGDSITEMEHISSLCGLPVFNAGISGSRVSDWSALGPYLIAKTKPRLIVVALGVNDAQKRWNFDPTVFDSAYRGILRTVRAPVVVVTPWGVEAASSDIIDRARLRNIQAAIDRMPATMTIKPIEPVGMTIDGVHPNARGRAIWRERLAAACKK